MVQTVAALRARLGIDQHASLSEPNILSMCTKKRRGACPRPTTTSC
jgi:hypothetical protein